MYDTTTGTSSAAVDVEVSWSTEPAGETIDIVLGGVTQSVDPATNTSPTTVQFAVAADGSTGNAITADFSGGTCGDADGDTYDAPADCAPIMLTCGDTFVDLSLIHISEPTRP